MMLRIGKNNSGDPEGSGRTGFTLVEVMVATAILSFGLVLIYQAFFTSIDAFDRHLNQLNAQIWLDEKFWQLQDDFRINKVFKPTKVSGVFLAKNKTFSWDMDYSTIMANELYMVNLNISWRQGQRNINMPRVLYVSNFEEKEE